MSSSEVPQVAKAAKASKDPRQRFSDRVANYTLYRPGYPVEAVDFIVSESRVGSQSTIADIGAGTGIFTELLLSSNSSVCAIEPNTSMRLASDKRLNAHANYESAEGSAEATGLAENTIDLITAAQAFHWFKFADTQKEFKRVLKPTGCIALIWNRRDTKESPFMQQYEALLSNQLPEYKKVSHANATDERIGEFLGHQMLTAEFAYHQDFDLDGLKGRLLSSSYCPAEGVAGHNEIMAQLENLYSRHASESGVRFDYRTQIYMSRV